ncbi:MAG TPA: bifunctional diguanylate cyclase/phosphodiesterase [Mycobacteriales bacterium]|nr:bifunctional diguanylate cyclase/phosphodiesterase [Mycobacteriales bacterium]
MQGFLPGPLAAPRLRLFLLTAAALASLLLVAAGAVAMELVTVATLVTVAALLLKGSRRDDALRRSRLLLLAALICSFTSALMVALYEVVAHREPPLPWIGDAVSLSYVPLTAAGLMLIPVGSRRTGHRARAVADGALVASSLWFLLIGFSTTQHRFVETHTPLATTVAYAFPIGDLFVVSVGLTVLARCAVATTRTVALMVAGLSVVASCDMWMFVSGHEHGVGFIAVVYQAGLLLLVGAAAAPAIPRTTPMAPRRLHGSVLEMFPFLPVLGSIAMTAELLSDGKGLPNRMLLPAMFIAVALVFRQFAATRDKQRLVDELDGRRVELESALRVDELTGLANRLGLNEALETALSDQAQWPVTLILVDLNGFKLINDNHGHATGDEVLRMLGQRMASRLRGADTIARLGGDEFAVLTCRVDDVRRTAVIDRLAACFDDPINIRDHSFTVHASIGVVTGQPPETGGQLLAHADAAMYRTKSHRRSHTAVTVLDATSRAEIARQLRISEDVANPDLKQFHVLYQPVVDLATGAIRGVEALLRWQHPELGMVSPGVFIPLAEQAGSINVLGAFALSTATSDFAHLYESHNRPGLRMAVNVSPRQLADPGFVDFALTTIRNAGLRADQITFEVTEQAFEANLHNASRTVADLRAAGAAIAVDDFGTGYSSLRYLQQLDLTVMKIDKLFVSDLRKPRTRQLVQSVIEMAASLNLQVVAEGIASIDQLRTLQQLNCELGQGYLFSPPVTVDEIEGLLASAHTYPVGLGDAAPILPRPRSPEQAAVHAGSGPQRASLE